MRAEPSVPKLDDVIETNRERPGSWRGEEGGLPPSRFRFG